MRNKVFIIIPVHNRIEYTKRCLDSLEKQDYKNFEVIVVDDGSTDGTPDFLNKTYPFWTIIKGNGKLWWTKSMYLGINQALKYSKKDDFILSLNNDCYAKKDYLKNIVNDSIKYNRSIVGSLVVDAENPKKIIEAGIKIDWKRHLIFATTDKISDLPNISSNGIVKNIDTLPGKGTLIPIEVIKSAGNFNYKRLPHYISDYEFFIRAKRSGFKLIVSLGSKLYNFSKATGTTHLKGFKSTYKEVFNVLFGRKSKLNIIDYLNFILLACPKEYLNINIKHFLGRVAHYMLNLSPFCYVGLVVSKVNLFFHNLPIIIRQLNKRDIGKYQCNICGDITYLKYKSLFDDRHGYPKKFDIYKCFNCGFMQTQPQLTERQLTNIYTKYYPKRDIDIDSVVNNAKNIPTKQEIKDKGLKTNCHYSTKKGQTVLDIGCGTCQSLLEIKRLKGTSWGIDPDKNSYNVAKKLGLKFHMGTIHNFKFDIHKFDLITASQVIEHEPDPLSFLTRCKDLLKDNGKIILSFPNANSLTYILFSKKWLHWHIPYHLNHFNYKSLKTLIKKSGLKINKIETVTPNLWTILQLRSIFAKVEVGQRDTFWDGQGEKNTNSKAKTINAIVQKILPVVQNILKINRFIDDAGLGDSFYLELKK